MPDLGIQFHIVRGNFPCQWCDKAKAFLEQQGAAVNVHVMAPGDLILKQAEVGHPTVPMVFHGHEFVGGHDALLAYFGQ